VIAEVDASSSGAACHAVARCIYEQALLSSQSRGPGAGRNEPWPGKAVVKIKVQETAGPIAPHVLAPIRTAVGLPSRAVVKADLNDDAATVSVAEVFSHQPWQWTARSGRNSRPWQSAWAERNSRGEPALRPYLWRKRIKAYRREGLGGRRIYLRTPRFIPERHGEATKDQRDSSMASHAWFTGSLRS
jgi:hypothetical protein